MARGSGLAAGVSARLTSSAGRRFGLELGGGFLLLGALFWWRSHPGLALVLAAAGVALVLAGLAFPTRLEPIRRSWMKFAALLSRFTTPIFMTVVYFAILTPFGLLLRFAGHRPLSRPGWQSSFWVRRKPGEGRSDLRHQF